jgi:hypothetical protein
MEEISDKQLANNQEKKRERVFMANTTKRASPSMMKLPQSE